jgi:hypothetical protein
VSISFKGSRLKIKRAYNHIHELETWVAELMRANIDAARAYNAENPHRSADHIMLVRPVGFSEDAAPILGDIVHNLRAALDLAASAIVIAGGEDPIQMYFPLTDTRDNLLKSEYYQRIKRLAPELAILIADHIKPYKAANYPLWALNRLDRMDKHRVLVPTITRSTHLVICIREEQENDPPPAPPGAIFGLAGVTLADGTVASVSRNPRPGTKAHEHNQQNGFATVDITFGKGEVFEGEFIIPKLRELAELVSGIIDTLEAHRLVDEPSG